MNTPPRETAATGSYPTFWDAPATQPAAPPVAPEQAYAEFVSVSEEGFPSGEYPIDRPAAALRVEGELRAGGTVVERSETEFQYVPGRSSREAGLLFQADPRRHTLQLHARSFQHP